MMRNSRDYFAAIDDNRKIWLNGHLVDGVLGSEHLRGNATEIGALYDLQLREDLSGLLTYDDEGTRYPAAFRPPVDAAALIARGRAYEVLAEATHGFLGRSPDYLHTWLAVMHAHSDWFGEYADNVRRYHDYVRSRNLFVTHSFTNPQTDRSRELGDLVTRERPIALQCVGKNSNGVLVSGARMMATSAPLADELLVMGGGRVLREDDHDLALGFAVPVGTEGLSFVCRGSYVGPDRRLARRFDEMDAVAVFDRVLIPWERVFIHLDPYKSNNFKAECGFFEHVGQQVLTRQLVKGRFLLAVGTAVAQAIGVTGFPNITEKLGRISTWLDVTEACLTASTTHPEPSGTTVRPQSRSINAGLRYFNDFYPTALTMLEEIAAGGLMLTPSVEGADEEVLETIDHYFQGASIGGVSRVQLFGIARELTGSSFGRRQSLFERYFSGEPARAFSAAFNRLDLLQIRQPIDRLLTTDAEGSGDARVHSALEVGM